MSTPSPTTIPGSDAALDTDYRRVIRTGLLILGLGFGGFFTWALFAPLDEGVPAPGVVSVESKRKRIDHLTGGLIEKILVQEGQYVREGEPLVVLNETQAKAGLNAAENQWRIATAIATRLEAERADRKTIQFPKELLDAAGDPGIAAALRAQEELFRARRGALEGELRIIRESINGLEQQLQSLNRLVEGREKQIRLFNEQFESYRKLQAGNFISRNQLIETERQLAEVQTRQSEDLANVAGVKARLAEFRMRRSQREIEYRREVETQLAEVQKDLSSLTERLTAQRDTYTRLALRAPVSGTVVDIAFHTIGGVIKPGERILDLVPDGDSLVVEARVAPQHIDRMRSGLPADVHLDAYIGSIDAPVVSGKVVTVSADALHDPRYGSPYYAIRVSVPAAELQKLGKIAMQPGMQCTVMIKTGERSLMTYLLRPLLRRLPTALGER